MTLDELVSLARERGASDVHLEGGLPAAFRVRGELHTIGEPLSPATLTAFAREVVGEDGWPDFLERQSADLAQRLGGVRCRINVLRSSRGAGLAIRLLSSAQATLQSLNLHPELRKLVQARHGLVLVSGPTGSGKSTTLSALLQEINLSEARHLVTIESPIEFALSPKQSFIRQREVGRDTPSFEQGLLDALRQDPDVLMVGEMREPSTMRLTLNAAETGHLVLATVHSSSCAEALQRVVSAFPSDIQPSICAQLADCLVGVVCQRLRYRPAVGLRVPECEVLMSSTQVKSLLRQGMLFKLAAAIETGASEGSYSFARYAEWLDRRTEWVHPKSEPEPASPRPAAARAEPQPLPAPPRRPARRTTPARPQPAEPTEPEDGVINLPDEGEDPDAILQELQNIARRKS